MSWSMVRAVRLNQAQLGPRLHHLQTFGRSCNMYGVFISLPKHEPLMAKLGKTCRIYRREEEKKQQMSLMSSLLVLCFFSCFPQTNNYGGKMPHLSYLFI